MLLLRMLKCYIDICWEGGMEGGGIARHAVSSVPFQSFPTTLRCRSYHSINCIDMYWQWKLFKVKLALILAIVKVDMYFFSRHISPDTSMSIYKHQLLTCMGSYQTRQVGR